MKTSRKIGGVATTLFMWAAIAPIAPAQSVTSDPILPLNNLGGSSAIDFSRRVAETTQTIHVPEGLSPAVLRGTLQLPAEYTGGIVEIHSANRLLTSVPIIAEGGRAEVSIPLDGVEITDEQATFTLRVVMDPRDDQWCADDPALSLEDSSVEFRGTTVDPTTVANFMPSVLQGLTLFVPSQASTSVQESALEIASAVTARYSPQHLDVAVEELLAGSESPETGADSFHRQIVITGSGDASAAVIDPGTDRAFLRLSGEGNALYDQTRLLSDSLLPLADNSQVTATGTSDIPTVSTDSATLSELGNLELSSESLGRVQVTVGIGAERLRSYVGALNVRLSGSYTPLPPANSGHITTTIGGKIIDQFTADSSGVIDRQLSISADQISRYTELVVELRSTGYISCGTTQPLSLSIDGDSLVHATHSDTPVSTGFAALPQAFQPDVDVSLATGDVADLRRAVDIITGVQSLGSQRIRPHVIAWEEALSSDRPALFVDANGDAAADLPLLVSSEGNTVRVTGSGKEGDSDDIRELTTGSIANVGSLQAVWDEASSRMVLIATSTGDAGQLDALLDWLGQDPSHWYGLSGDAVVQTMGQDPVSLDLDSSTSESTQSKPSWPVVATVAALIVALALVALAVLSKRPRRADSQK